MWHMTDSTANQCFILIQVGLIILVLLKVLFEFLEIKLPFEA